MKRITITFTILYLFFSGICLANSPSPSNPISTYDMKTYDKEFSNLCALNKKLSSTLSTTDRIVKLSAFFLGKPYEFNPLGEGPTAKFDQNPLYRTDKFDCVTYVNTVLALAHSNNLEEFQKNMNKMNYRNANPSFVNRFHFQNIDWNYTNTLNGYVKDITDKIVNPHGKSIAKISNTLIDKPSWYKQLPIDRIKQTKPLTSQQAENLLKELREQGKLTQQEKSTLLYIPLTELFDSNGQPKENIFKQIPNVAIIEIVRPNWSLKSKIGTNLDISHLGFAIRTPQGLIFREASTDEMKVIDIPLSNYLKPYLKSSTVKGIQVLEIVEAAH
ncbi:MAG: DUF1460 domain-containing protein [Proteobacteria bacterium]|nr:DUF1460 domain-containing protein [Pseudomonadota bacterium]